MSVIGVGSKGIGIQEQNKPFVQCPSGDGSSFASIGYLSQRYPWPKVHDVTGVSAGEYYCTLHVNPGCRWTYRLAAANCETWVNKINHPPAADGPPQLVVF